MRVVWDGTRNGPGGAQLFTEEGEVRKVEPVYRVRGGNRERVLEILARGPHSSRELSVLLRMDIATVHDALRPLRVEGRVSVTRGAFKRFIYTLVRP